MTAATTKPPGRVVDPEALRRARVREDACAACGRTPGSVHHVVPRSGGGDDVAGNLTMVCGHGTAGCHGALHGNPYEAHDGKRWSQQETAAAVGRHLLANRPDAITYVLTKLGRDAGREYLRRRYHLHVPDDAGTPDLA